MTIHTRLKIHLSSLLLMLAVCSPDGVGANGFGARGVYSLDSTSPHLMINPNNLPSDSAADLFVDDSDDDNMLTIDVDAAGLGLAPAHNVDALSSGRDFIPFFDVLNVPEAIYQFSVDRDSVNGFQGTIATVGPPFSVDIFTTPSYVTQFPDDQASDVFNNAGPAGLRFNWLGVAEEKFELVGNPDGGPPIDNADAIANFGGLGINGMLGPFGPTLGGNPGDPPAKNVYFSVDPATAADLGVSAADILAVPAGGGPIQVFASAADLGLQAGDDVDGLCVRDLNQNLAFDPTDRVVISLAAGSPCLPVAGPGGFDLTEGGVALLAPGVGFPGLDWLPRHYFGAGAGDELDALHCADPRDPNPQWLPVLAVLDTFLVTPASSVFDSSTGIRMFFPPGSVSGEQEFITVSEVPGSPNEDLDLVRTELVQLALTSGAAPSVDLRFSQLGFNPEAPPEITLPYEESSLSRPESAVDVLFDATFSRPGEVTTPENPFSTEGVVVIDRDPFANTVTFTTTHFTPFLVLSTHVFTDGFESGDLSAWSETVQ